MNWREMQPALAATQTEQSAAVATEQFHLDQGTSPTATHLPDKTRGRHYTFSYIWGIASSVMAGLDLEISGELTPVKFRMQKSASAALE
jgi:hypothetical protein